MACPECNSKNILNENTGRDPMLKLIGGTFHLVCGDCGCRWTSRCATGRDITTHGKFFQGIKKKGEFKSRLKRIIKDILSKQVP